MNKMEYIYAAMLLHKSKQKIDDAAVKKVLSAAGITPDDARVKALVAALDGVDIDKAIKEAVVSAPAQASAPAATAEKKEAKPEKSAEDEKKQEEQAAAGLGALFG
jgi:large subunit ribosomal protein L12